MVEKVHTTYLGGKPTNRLEGGIDEGNNIKKRRM
jgi:hypothetical protein